MADGIASNNDIAVRKRKTHRKSRLGCGNCKIRSVKGRLGEYALRPEDHAALSRFYGRTASTLGTPTMRDGYFKVVHSLVDEHAFLIHILLAITLLHDTHLSQAPLPPSHSHSLAFHWYHSTAILKHFLALPSPATTLSSTHRDALWVCASILGATSFASIRTQDPLAAWPLADPNPAVDLDWLKMGYGKKVVWDIADPSRPESVFHNILHNTPMQQHIDTSAPISPGVFPPFVYSFFGLSTPTSSADTNPYHRACVILSVLWPNTINEDNAILFLTFITHIDPTYRSLLEEKDPRALLLLLFWHCLVVPLENWWLRRRCVVEAKAICMYLDKHCADDEGIIKMLEMPKEVLANSC
ncbi:hypothetical protein TASIC1_0011005100 [Trichoderma asperellum]|uniref:Sterol uptake control protein 2 n=1 Tax=Trichoderma asperellum TaxID=101201 RepID=A0A6V8R0W6_TRIAP|nr:hypothetical protein TASIC1_0011005100 [Trichoderma asperellum]